MGCPAGTPVGISVGEPFQNKSPKAVITTADRGVARMTHGVRLV